MTFSLPFRVRLHAASRDFEMRTGISTTDWSDDQRVSALALIGGGHSARDAAAIVTGDAVLEDGIIDYDPGCAWIDSILYRRPRTQEECDHILAQWETRRDDAGLPRRGPTMVDSAMAGRPPRPTMRRLHLVS